MSTILSFLGGKPMVYGALVVLIVAGAALVLLGKGGSEEELLTVSRGPFVQEVSVSGKVVAARHVDLAFDTTGRITSIFVEVGDRVAAGQIVATIGTDVLLADFRAAEVELEEIKAEQATLVESAYRTLLSTGLVAVPSVSTYTVSSPMISGLYDGPEGTYKVSIDRRSVNANDYVLNTFELEYVRRTLIEKNEPTKLGTRGLYISFPDEIRDYDDTIWNVTIPNKKSDSYLANYNAYQEALRTHDKTIANAEAAIKSVETEITERTLRAPFAGIVTAVEAERGAIASSGEIAVSIQSDDTLQIESFVPEVNIALVEVGDKAGVTLDAYGGDVVFSARVVSIDPAETVRDGVSTYRAILQFKDRDERVRSGMTANVRITTDRREGVISIPRGVVIERDGKKYVRLKIGNSIEEHEVTTGAVSSLGNIEILSGLSEGDIVLLSEPQADSSFISHENAREIH